VGHAAHDHGRVPHYTDRHERVQLNVPAAIRFAALLVKVQVPRRTRAMLPFTAGLIDAACAQSGKIQATQDALTGS